ncbi:MAG: phosphatidylglycerol lysyltransferase domain-containing protein [Mycoplasmoidaceae bacterium]
MNNEIKWYNLNWETYKTIDNITSSYDFNEPLSALTYLSWKYYGISIKFAIYKKSILLIGEIDKSYFRVDRNQFVTNCMMNNNIRNLVIRPYFIDEDINEMINICKAEIGTDKPILLEAFYTSDLINVENKVPLWNWISNFIYETEKLKTFDGKSLQKRRNLLNYFKKHYAAQSSMKILTLEHIQEVIDFINLEESELKYTNYEKDLYIDLLNNFNPETMKGSILYYEEKIVGFTLGYLRKDYYEIFIEKCQHDLKGSFQYMLSENLKLNNIYTKYVDRQDSASIDALTKSKKSYKPIQMNERNVYFIEK